MARSITETINTLFPVVNFFKCVVAEVVLFPIVAFETLAFPKVVQRRTRGVVGSLGHEITDVERRRSCYGLIVNMFTKRRQSLVTRRHAENSLSNRSSTFASEANSYIQRRRGLKTVAGQ